MSLTGYETAFRRREMRDGGRRDTLLGLLVLIYSALASSSQGEEDLSSIQRWSNSGS